MGIVDLPRVLAGARGGRVWEGVAEGRDSVEDRIWGRGRGDFGKDVPDAHAGCHVLRERPPRPLRGEEGVQGRSPWLGFSREPGSLTGLAIATLSDILMEWPRE